MAAKRALGLYTAPANAVKEIQNTDTVELNAGSTVDSVPIVTTTDTQTLTNKTITNPKIENVYAPGTNNQTLVLSDSAGASNYVSIGNISDGLATGAGLRIRAVGSAAAINLTLYPKGSGVLQTRNDSDATLRPVATTTGSQTLSNKTLTTPTLTVPVIADFTSAQHDHSSDATGGALSGVTVAVHKDRTGDSGKTVSSNGSEDTLYAGLGGVGVILNGIATVSAGTIWRVLLRGKYSTAGGANVLTLRLYASDTANGTTTKVWEYGATLQANQTDQPWIADVDLHMNTAALDTGQTIGHQVLQYGFVTGGVNHTNTFYAAPLTSAATIQCLSWNPVYLHLTAHWSAAANSVTIESVVVERIT